MTPTRHPQPRHVHSKVRIEAFQPGNPSGRQPVEVPADFDHVERIGGRAYQPGVPLERLVELHGWEFDMEDPHTGVIHHVSLSDWRGSKGTHIHISLAHHRRPRWWPNAVATRPWQSEHVDERRIEGLPGVRVSP
jgi:hypothetical protein